MFLKITALVVLVAIAYLSITPTDTITIGNDKISHFIAYGVLSLNLTLVVHPVMKKMIACFLLAVSYGALMEVIQHYVPGREMSVWDFYADVIGALIGMLITIFIGKAIKKALVFAKLI